MENVLVDSSVWIELFRSSPPEVVRGLDALGNAGVTWTSRVVIAELMTGAPTDEAAQELRLGFSLLPMVQESLDDWYDAGLVRRRILRGGRHGRTPSLVDCYLAVVAGKNHALIWTLDRAFDSLKSEGVRLYRP